MTKAPRSTAWYFTATTPTGTDTVRVDGTKTAATDYARRVFAFRGITDYELTVTR